MEPLSKDKQRPIAPAAWLALLLSTATIVLLAGLHVLSPEFDPSWRVISEYALGRYGWVLSLLFLCWGLSSWTLALALSSEVHTRAGKVGLFFLVVAGVGETMASYFDITRMIGHGIAGLLGVGGFPVAALLLSVALGHNEEWHRLKRTLLGIANLCWISVVLLAIGLATFMTQMAHANGGHFPHHAPKSLPAGVVAFDGWADRLIVVSYCAWVFVAAWHAIRLHRTPHAAHD